MLKYLIRRVARDINFRMPQEPRDDTIQWDPNLPVGEL